MTQPKKIDFQKIKMQLQVKKPWDHIIIFFLNLLIAFPIFIILHQNIINPNWPFNIDRIFLFLVLLAVIHFVLLSLRTIIIVCLAIYEAIAWTSSCKGGFSAISNT